MPINPVAKPSNPIYTAGGTYGSTIQAAICFEKALGLPGELRSGRVAMPMRGQNAASSNQPAAIAQYGKEAVWAPTTTIGATSAGPAYKFDHSSPGLMWPGVGFPTSTSGSATARTYAGIFMHHMATYNKFSASNLFTPMWTSGGSGYNGIGLSLPAPTNPSPDAMILDFLNYNGHVSSLPPLEIYRDRWTAFAFTEDVASAGSSAKRIQLYDYNNGSYHPLTAGGTMQIIDTSVGIVTSNDLNAYLCGFSVGLENPFIGQWACAILDNASWNATTFTNFVTDPWNFARGAYSAAGAPAGLGSSILAATTGGGREAQCTTTTVSLSVPRATGTGTGGTGVWTYGLTKSLSPTMSSPITLTPTSDVTGPMLYFADTTCSPGDEWFYQVTGTDGTSILQSIPIFASTYYKAEMLTAIAADSKVQITGVGEFFAAHGAADGRIMTVVNTGRFQAGLSANNVPGSARYNSQVAAAVVNQKATLTPFNGTPSAGTQNFIIPFGLPAVGSFPTTPVTISATAYNATAAAVQTATNTALATALGGLYTAGDMAVSGGPIGTAPIVFTGAGGLFLGTNWPMPYFDMAGSTLTVTPTVATVPYYFTSTLTQVAQNTTTTNNIFNMDVAEFNRVQVTSLVIQFGANDTPNAQWAIDYSNYITNIIASVPTLANITCVPPQTRRLGYNAPDPAADGTYFQFAALIATAISTASKGSVNVKIGRSSNFTASVRMMTGVTYPDGVHETGSGPFLSITAGGYYKSMTDMTDVVASGGFPSIGSSFVH